MNSNFNTYPRLKSEESIGIPLSEIDQSVIEDTYCIITKRWGQTYVNRYSRLPTLYFFHPYSSVRRAAIACTTHVCYDICITFVTFANLINLAVPNSLPIVFERVTLIFYLIEAFYQTIGRGFIFGSYSYLKNPWMCFDFIITLLSLPDLELNVNEILGMQSLRGIRALNMISKIPGVQIITEGIILSILRMYGVAMITFLFLLSVTLTAKQLFMGIFHQRCVKILPPDFFHTNESYSDFINDVNNWDVDDHSNFMMCGNYTGAQKCKINFTCLSTTRDHVEHMESEYTGFDTFGLSLISSFRLLTDNDSEIIYDDIIEATGPISFLFFLPVLFLGSYFLINLTLVVVTSTFDSIMNTKEKHRFLYAYTYHSSFCFDVNLLTLYPLPASSEVLKKVFKERDEILEHKRWLNDTWNKTKNLIVLKLNLNKSHHSEEDTNSVGNWEKFRKKCKIVSGSKPFQYFILLTIIFNTALLASGHANMSKNASLALKYCNMVVTGIFTLEVIIKLIAYGKNFFFKWWNIFDFLVVIQSLVTIFLQFVGEYSILSAVRLLELVKVQHAWPALHRVISTVLSSLENIFRLLFVMILIIFTFAVIGNKIIGPRMIMIDEMPRWSFKYFGGSMFTVFKIFAGDWYRPLSACMAASRIPLLCSVIIFFFLIGYMVILNFFVAVLLSAFDASALDLPELKKTKAPLLRENDNVEEAVEDASSFKWVHSRLKSFVKSSYFDYIVLVLVIGSCITMAFEDIYLDSKPNVKYIIDLSNILFATVFAIEAFIRCLTVGIKKYFADAWMRFDFFLVVLSLIELFIIYTFNLSERNKHSLKALRALRPLRLIPRWNSLQLVTDSLVLSLPAIFHVVLVVLFIWLPFAILGVHFFAGKFFHCNNKFQERVSDYVYNKTNCLAKGYRWEDTFYNFNHIGNSYLSLIQLAMFTGWTDLVQMMVDFSGEDLQPVNNNSKEYYAFVVAFVFVGGFFSFNLFVGVAVDTFKNSQKQVKMKKSEVLLTDPQKRYYAAMLKLGERKPVKRTNRPSNKVLYICYKITYSLWFRVLILIFICANTVTISLNTHHDTPQKKKILHYFDLFFTLTYILELIIKILGLRKFYLNDFWNIFDFLILCLYIVGEFIPNDDKAFNPLSFVYAYRLLRLLRLLRLTDMLIDLRRLLHSMVASIPALMNISILLFIIIFIYSFLGMSLFGHQDIHGDITTKINFQTFIQSYLLLFRLTTAEGWENILEALSIKPPFCNEEKETCGNFVISLIFMLSFIIISNILLVNIFIAVILEKYIEAILQENDVITDDNLDNFYRLWKEFDPKATQFIEYEQLSKFLDQLNKDMRIPKPNQIAIAYMNLPVVEGRKIHCLNVLKGILEIKAGGVEDSATFRIVCDQLQKKHYKMFPKLKKSRFIETTMQLRQRDYAARVLQSNLKRMKQRKTLNLQQSLGIS